MESVRILQEFYCGECSHYIRIPLKMNWNRTVYINCPMCGHQHQRYIEDGVIYERGRYENGEVKEEIHPLKSAASKEPITKAMLEAEKKNRWAGRRDGAVIDETPPMTEEEKREAFWKSFKEAWRKQTMAELWADKAWRERYGDND